MLILPKDLQLEYEQKITELYIKTIKMPVSEVQKRIISNVYKHFHGESVQDIIARKDRKIEEQALREKEMALREKKERTLREQEQTKSVRQFLILGMTPEAIVELLEISLERVLEIKNDIK